MAFGTTLSGVVNVSIYVETTYTARCDTCGRHCMHDGTTAIEAWQVAARFGWMRDAAGHWCPECWADRLTIPGMAAS